MRDISSWRKDTTLLSFEEQGYYSALLDLIYLYDDSLPDDDKFISKAMPVNMKIHLRLKKILLNGGFITSQDGFVTNSKATQELLKINSTSTQNQLKADKRWLKHSKQKKSAMPRQCKGESEREREDNTNVLSREGSEKYKFEGKIIKLTIEDYNQWKKSYHAIPDLDAALQSADDWIRAENPKQQKRWFNMVSGMLSNKHNKFLNEATEDDQGTFGNRPKNWGII